MKCNIRAVNATQTMNKQFREESSHDVCRKYEVYKLRKELQPHMTCFSTLCCCILSLCHIPPDGFHVFSLYEHYIACLTTALPNRHGDLSWEVVQMCSSGHKNL